MRDPSFVSPAGPPASAAAAKSDGLIRIFWILAAITLARVVYLALHPFDLHPDEAQYWVWAQDFAFGYYSKPPMVAWLIAATTAACGDGEACVRLGAPFVHMATALAVYGIGRRLYSGRIGFWAALVYATLPGVSFSAVVLSTDVPLLFFWALGLYAFVRALQHNSWRWWLLMGAAIGLGMLSKYAMVFFVASAAIYLALERRTVATTLPGFAWRVVAALATATLIYLPNLLWNAANSFVSYAHTEDNVNLSGELFRFDSLLAFVGAQFGVFGPILFGVLIVIVLRWRGWVGDRRARLLVCFILPTLALMIGQSFLSRANANWAAPVYIAASVLVSAGVIEGWRAASLWRGRGLLISGSILLHLGAVAILCVFLVATYGLPDALPAKADPFKRVRGWHELGGTIALARREVGVLPILVDERKLMAEVLYYGRPWVAGAVKWRPGSIHDHFDLTRPLVASAAPPKLMLVTERQDVSEIISRFANSHILAEIRTPIGIDRERVVRLYELEGFLGYPAKP